MSALAVPVVPPVRTVPLPQRRAAQEAALAEVLAAARRSNLDRPLNRPVLAGTVLEVLQAALELLAPTRGQQTGEALTLAWALGMTQAKATARVQVPGIARGQA
jgi:hypothetical protein